MARSGTADGQLTREVELISPAEEVYIIYRRTCHLFPKIPNSGIRKVELIGGDCWEDKSSKRRWTFVDGTCETWEDTVSDVDDTTNSVTFTLVHGAVSSRLCKSLESVYNFTRVGKGCTAKVALNYEKRLSETPYPTDYMDFIINMLKAVDAYLQGPRS